MLKMSTIGQNARWHFEWHFPKQLEILVQILHAYYTLDYKFLFIYLQTLALYKSFTYLLTYCDEVMSY